MVKINSGPDFEAGEFEGQTLPPPPEVCLGEWGWAPFSIEPVTESRQSLSAERFDVGGGAGQEAFAHPASEGSPCLGGAGWVRE